MQSSIKHLLKHFALVLKAKLNQLKPFVRFVFQPSTLLHPPINQFIKGLHTQTFFTLLYASFSCPYIEGKAEKCPPKDSDAYFSTRPYKSKIGARISPQSRIINNRTEIIRAFVKEAIKLTGQRIQRPGSWGGFAVTPTRFEFWQGRENRLHDRFLYTLCKEEHISSSSSPESDGWRIVRLAP